MTVQSKLHSDLTALIRQWTASSNGQTNLSKSKTLPEGIISKCSQAEQLDPTNFSTELKSSAHFSWWGQVLPPEQYIYFWLWGEPHVLHHTSTGHVHVFSYQHANMYTPFAASQDNYSEWFSETWQRWRGFFLKKSWQTLVQTIWNPCCNIQPDTKCCVCLNCTNHFVPFRHHRKEDAIVLWVWSNDPTVSSANFLIFGHFAVASKHEFKFFVGQTWKETEQFPWLWKLTLLDKNFCKRHVENWTRLLCHFRCGRNPRRNPATLTHKTHLPFQKH